MHHLSLAPMAIPHAHHSWPILEDSDPLVSPSSHRLTALLRRQLCHFNLDSHNRVQQASAVVSRKYNPVVIDGTFSFSPGTGAHHYVDLERSPVSVSLWHGLASISLETVRTKTSPRYMHTLATRTRGVGWRSPKSIRRRSIGTTCVW